MFLMWDEPTQVAMDGTTPGSSRSPAFTEAAQMWITDVLNALCALPAIDAPQQVLRLPRVPLAIDLRAHLPDSAVSGEGQPWWQ